MDDRGTEITEDNLQRESKGINEFDVKYTPGRGAFRKLVFYGGEWKSIKDLAARHNMTENGIVNRIKSKIPLEYTRKQARAHSEVKRGRKAKAANSTSWAIRRFLCEIPRPTVFGE